MPVAPYAALDDALEAMAAYGPDLANGLTSHGPMAAEALCALGRPDAVLPWVERYRQGMLPRPPARERIVPERWRDALAQRRTVRPHQLRPAARTSLMRGLWVCARHTGVTASVTPCGPGESNAASRPRVADARCGIDTRSAGGGIRPADEPAGRDQGGPWCLPICAGSPAPSRRRSMR